MRPNSSNRIYMDSSTIEHGKECVDCLRWFVSIYVDDECPHCLKHGCPQYPNRVRYLAVKNGMSLREVSRKAKLNWRTIRLVSQGKRAPHILTKKKVLKVLGLPVRKSELNYVFPTARQRL